MSVKQDSQRGLQWHCTILQELKASHVHLAGHLCRFLIVREEQSLSLTSTRPKYRL